MDSIQKEYRAIGLMSGTSLDGLDIALVHFIPGKNSLQWNLLEAATMEYPATLRNTLARAIGRDRGQLIALDADLGAFFGRQVHAFLEQHRVSVDFIASHGHTIRHRPEQGITLQIGNPEILAELTGVPVISDFRSEDVRKGGQGAPLVPVGDRDLFIEFDSCLNLGGIANISFREGEQMRAYDIVPCNLVLNHLAEKEGEAYDRDGRTAARGSVHTTLLRTLDNLPYYGMSAPKSLGREWVEERVFPLIETFEIPLEDKMRTAVEHICHQIRAVQGHHPPGSEMLVTGGGALNRFLMNRLKSTVDTDIVIPSRAIVQFKEAIVFAYLGLLRMLNRINVLASVTGARGDSCSGTITKPK
jgi:anhydro-N-acetylmuramic acid kinase